MKRAGCLFDKICCFDNLYHAFKKAFRGSGSTEESCRFFFNLENELLLLREELISDTYTPARYRYFVIHDPKQRTISVAPFRDRVVHHAIVRVIDPLFDRTFIFDSYANRRNKGTHKAIAQAQRFLQIHGYYLKTDIAHYFNAIDHQTLLAIIAHKVKDKKALHLIGRIVKNSDQSRGLAAGKGLPIGNLTSQFLANVYLNPCDHFIKQCLGLQCYIRYMDDMVFFSQSKEFLKEILRRLETYLSDTLQLRLKEKATLLNTRLHGLPFLGFRIFPHLIRIKSENLRRMKRRMGQREREFAVGLITEDKMAMSIQSMFAHIHHAQSYLLRSKMLNERAGVV